MRRLCHALPASRGDRALSDKLKRLQRTAERLFGAFLDVRAPLRALENATPPKIFPPFANFFLHRGNLRLSIFFATHSHVPMAHRGYATT
jgi:hypothetical protein